MDKKKIFLQIIEDAIRHSRLASIFYHVCKITDHEENLHLYWPAVKLMGVKDGDIYDDEKGPNIGLIFFAIRDSDIDPKAGANMFYDYIESVSK